MAKNVGRLAGLAALGAAAYMINEKLKGKDEVTPKGKADTGPGYKSTETGRDKSPTADEKTKSDVLSAITKPRDKSNDAAGNDGVISAPVNKSNVETRNLSTKVDDDKKADANNTTANAASNVPLYKQSNVTIGGQEKRNEGNKPMPSLRAVEAKAASNKTDAMRNASRAQQAAVNRMKAMKANPEAQAVEGVYPEQYVVAPGAKTVASMAKSFAGRKAVPEYSTPLLNAPAKQLTGPSKADLLARDRAARAAGRQESMLQENARRYGLNPEAPGYEGAAGALRKNLGGEDFSLGMKRGGAVKKMASGGMTASKRADGIASRGKTRCKMY